MKLVDLVARIPKHLDLNFFSSTNFYAFPKFTALSSIEFMLFLQFSPWDFGFFSGKVPGR